MILHMVLNIDVDPQTESRLQQQAKAAGKDVRAYVSELIELAAAKPSLEEALAPLRQQFSATGIGDEELLRDITDSQAEYRAQKHKKSA